MMAPCVPLPIEAQVSVDWPKPVLVELKQDGVYVHAVYGVCVTWSELTFRVHLMPAATSVDAPRWVDSQLAGLKWEEALHGVVMSETRSFEAMQRVDAASVPLNNAQLDHVVGDLVALLRQLGATDRASQIQGLGASWLS